MCEHEVNEDHVPVINEDHCTDHDEDDGPYYFMSVDISFAVFIDVIIPQSSNQKWT